MKESQSLRWFQGKMMLALIRGGDYAHAGEEDAIRRALDRFPKESTQRILDVGCGLGGTAEFMRKNGWGHVVGADIEEPAIQYAKGKYPDVKFYISDVTQIDSLLAGKKFDLICLFNSFYAFPDKLQALQALRNLANDHANLVIFDYTDLTADGNNPINNTSDPQRYFMAIRPNEFPGMLNKAGWTLTEEVKLNQEYEQWYEELIERLERNHETILEKFDSELYDHAHSRYTEMLDAIKDQHLGGSIFYATK